tara:strand:+ start:121 stop:1002 length:882 start_codon:yes stop_codon:yes gene_type:complete
MKLSVRQNKLVLGTAQFGSNYGITNKNIIGEKEAKEILKFCYKNNIKEIDTAIDYKKCEEILGTINLTNYKISTKLSKKNKKIKNIEKWINDEVTRSLKKLNQSSVNTLYLHNPRDLLGDNGLEIYQAIKLLKSNRIIKNIGISIYSPETMIEIISQFKIDVVQFPLNILDNRFNKQTIISELKKQSIKVYIRSIFLQGLLITRSNNHHIYFKKWHRVFRKWESWLAENNLSATEVCLNHALSSIKEAKVVLGISSLDDLIEISNQRTDNIPTIPSDIKCNDLELIDPRKWDL